MGRVGRQKDRETRQSLRLQGEAGPARQGGRASPGRESSPNLVTNCGSHSLHTAQAPPWALGPGPLPRKKRKRRGRNLPCRATHLQPQAGKQLPWAHKAQGKTECQEEGAEVSTPNDKRRRLAATRKRANVTQKPHGPQIRGCGWAMWGALSPTSSGSGSLRGMRAQRHPSF